MSDFDNLKKELQNLGFGAEQPIAESVIHPDNSSVFTYHVKLDESQQNLYVLIFKFTTSAGEINQLDVTLTGYNDYHPDGAILMVNVYNEKPLPTKKEMCQRATEVIYEEKQRLKASQIILKMKEASENRNQDLKRRM